MDKAAEEPAATGQSQEIWEFIESESWSNYEKGVAGTLVAKEKGTERAVASRSSENSVIPEAEKKKWSHNFFMSSAMVPHTEKVDSVVRKIHGRSLTDDLDDLDVNPAVLGFFCEYHTTSSSSSWCRLHVSFYDSFKMSF